MACRWARQKPNEIRTAGSVQSPSHPFASRFLFQSILEFIMRALKVGQAKMAQRVKWPKAERLYFQPRKSGKIRKQPHPTRSLERAVVTMSTVSRFLPHNALTGNDFFKGGAQTEERGTDAKRQRHHDGIVIFGKAKEWRKKLDKTNPPPPPPVA